MPSDQYRQAIADAVAQGGEGFQEFLAEKGYANAEQITLGLLKAYAKEFREKGHLARCNLKTYGGQLPEE